MMKYLLFILFGNMVCAQTVSTFFSDPTKDVTDAIAFDADGNLYGSDFSGDTVYKINPEGAATSFVTGLARPNGLAFDSEGNLFVVEFSGGKIHKYDSTGVLLQSFDVGSSPSGLIKSFNSDDMIFTLTSDSSVNILSQDGTITQIYQGAPLNAPVGLAYDELGNLFAGNIIGREIYRVFNGGTEFIAKVPDGGDSNSSLAFIAYGQGSLWGTVFFNGNSIYKINPNETDEVALFAGSTQGNIDGDINVATFDSPSGIVYNDEENALYISEYSAEGNIRKIEGIPLAIEGYKLNQQLTLFPNPTTNILKLVGTLQDPLDETKISIYDLAGRLMSTNNQRLNEKDFHITIDVSSLMEGMYLLELQSANGFFIAERFIKRR